MPNKGRPPSEDKRGVDVDAIWKQIGPNKRYRGIQWALTTIATALYAIPVMDFVFTGYKPDHQCSHVENFTQLEDYLPDDVTNFTLHDVRYEECSIDVTVNRSGVSSTHSLPCVAGINFSMPSDTSFTTEWSLVCDKAGLAQLTQTGVFGGQIAGRALASILADRYGRKKLYVICTLSATLCLVVQSLAPYFYMFLACKIAVGVFVSGMVRASYTLLIESLPQDCRHLASVSGSCMWVLGCLTLASTAYGMQGWSWRHLSLALYSFYLISLLLPFILSKSVRWLLATGEVKEAERVLQKVCRASGTDFSRIQPMLYRHTPLQPLPSHHASEGQHSKTDPGKEELADDTKLAGEETTNLKDVELGNEEETKREGGRDGENGGEMPENKKNKTRSEDEKMLIATEHVNEERNENGKETNHAKATSEHSEKVGDDDEEAARKERVDDALYANGRMSGNGGVDGWGDGGEAGEKERNCAMASSEETAGEGVFSAKYTVLDLFRYRAVFVPFLVTCLVWASNNLYYYVTMMGSAQLSGNRFLNFSLLSMVEIPAGILALFLVPRFNRRPLAFGYGVVAALFLFLTVGLTSLGGGNSTILTLATVSQYLGMFTLTGSYILLFTYHMEQYPTSLRAIGSGMAGTVTEFTNMTSPFLLLWAEKTAWAPGVFMGCFCCLASSSVWLLPETRHRKLADTIEEVQSWKRK